MTMEAKQWTTIDKSRWSRGPWDNEPDKAQWPDPSTGLPCLIVRNTSGALCGYVGVAPGHPCHGVNYSDVDVDVHGGLTFSDHCDPRGSADESRHICHVPGTGEPDHLWWLGFDCNHGCDRAPGSEAYWREHGREWGEMSEWYAAYRDIDYVKNQCRRLAAQLADISPGSGRKDG